MGHLRPSGENCSRLTVRTPKFAGEPIWYTAMRRKLPEWGCCTVTPEHAVGCEVRNNAFAADDTLRRAVAPSRLTMWARIRMGHIAPDRECAESDVERESFMLSHMTPNSRV